jgi:hypothetical protein
MHECAGRQIARNVHRCSTPIQDTIHSNDESNAGRQHSDDLKHGCEVDAALSQVLVSLCLRQQACPWPQSQVWRGVYWPGSAVHGDSLSRSWTHGPGQDVKGSCESAGHTTGLALVFGTCATALTVCRASKLTEERALSSLCQRQARAQRRASSRPTRGQLCQRRPSTHSDT